MKTYYASFRGIYIGGHAVIIAKNKRQAKVLIQKALESELGKTPDFYVRLLKSDKPSVVQFDNGDY